LGIFVIAGSFLGYRQGITERKNYESTQVALAIGEQYEMGLQDMAEGRYEVARQRFDYVIQKDPNYPGVIDQMTEVQIILNATATPTPVPPTAIPTEIPLTPTPDLRGEEELFLHAQTLIAEQQWTAAITDLETLRKKNPDFKAIEVDGMFFVAFRNRGAQNIGAGNLESGIYDLTLAERFGVLDTEANGYRTWARYYITGASFWGVDWSQAVYYFGQVAPQYPNMHDGTGWTASQRYVEAIVGYAQWYDAQGKWCAAEEHYHAAFELSGNPEYEKARDIASDRCNAGE
jgi:tetratricopeptide (TPR) repeat protein